MKGSTSFPLIADQLDKVTRHELQMGILSSENDYVSAFMSRIRDFVLRSSLGYVAQRLPESDERRFGCDAVIVVRGDGWAKPLFLEAKYPRFRRRRRFDSPTKTTSSRFWSQWRRQQALVGSATVAQMFLHECSFGCGAPAWTHDTSSYVLHNDGFPFARKRGDVRWNAGTVDDLLNEMVQNGTSAKSVGEILEEMQACRLGRRISVENSRLSFIVEPHDGQDATLEPEEFSLSMEGIDSTTWATMEAFGLSHLVVLDDPDGSRGARRPDSSFGFRHR